MVQTWKHLLFAHWPVDIEMLRTLVRPPLVVETFDGHAWVGLTPFHLSRLRLRGLPPVPGMSSFTELNLRTYVK